jgi:hypothetical protein
MHIYMYINVCIYIDIYTSIHVYNHTYYLFILERHTLRKIKPRACCFIFGLILIRTYVRTNS